MTTITIDETLVGIEQAHPSDPDQLRLFNPETGDRSRAFSALLYRNVWGLLEPPIWAFSEIGAIVEEADK